ncbi:MAG: sugar phosphate nucleotidyltransferase [Bacteroidota bacterium]
MDKNKHKPTLLILAAGLGSRYESLKQIDKIGPSGERIIDYSVYDALRAGFGKIVYVIRKSFEEEFKEVILDELPSSIETDYVFQEVDLTNTDIKTNVNREKPWGTGQAILTASDVIKNPFVVINADDFYGAESYKIAYDHLKSINNSDTNYALIGYKLSNTMSDYGSVSRGVCSIDENEFLTSVIERTEIKKENDHPVYKDDYGNWQNLTGSEIVSMNMFAFTPTIFSMTEKLFSIFVQNNKDNLKTEFYLPYAVDELIKQKQVNVEVLNTNEQWFGLTYKEDKEIVRAKILELVNQGRYPEKLWM